MYKDEDVHIRRMVLSDIDNGLLETLASVYPHPIGRAEAYAMYNRHDIISNIATIVATYKDKIIGTAMMYFENAKNNMLFCWLEDVAVYPAHQRHGVGQKLIEECEKEAKKRECYKIELNSTFKAIPFYEKLGFKSVGTGEKMRKDLI